LRNFYAIILHLSNIQIFKIIPFGGKQMNRILAVGILLVMAGCSVTQPYVTNISPAGEQGILVEKCKVQFNSLTAKVSTEQCNTSYVWLGNASMGKAKAKDGTNPNNNVITIK
jgi:type IV secretion system protein VirB7